MICNISFFVINYETAAQPLRGRRPSKEETKQTKIAQTPKQYQTEPSPMAPRGS